MWRKNVPLVATLAVQILILAAVPGRRVLAHLHGTPITLRTRPVDPYDMLAGYYMTLAYEVEDTKWTSGAPPEIGDTVYITLVRDTPAWRGLAVTREPQPSSESQVSIKATWTHTWSGARPMLTDASRFYLPETERNDASRRFQEQGSHGLVDMKVANDGTPALLRLRVGDKTFGR